MGNRLVAAFFAAGPVRLCVCYQSLIWVPFMPLPMAMQTCKTCKVLTGAVRFERTDPATTGSLDYKSSGLTPSPMLPIIVGGSKLSGSLLPPIFCMTD